MKKGSMKPWKDSHPSLFLLLLRSSSQSQYRSRRIHCLSRPIQHSCTLIWLCSLWEQCEWCYSGKYQGTWSHGFWQTVFTVHGARLHLQGNQTETNEAARWISPIHLCEVFVCTALPVMWPLQKHSETLLTISAYNKGNIGFCLHLVWVWPVRSYDGIFFLPLWRTVMFLWFNRLYMCVPLSICLTKLTSITSILCIPLQRHKAGDADKRCANVWLVGPASPECSLSLSLGILSKLAWWGSGFPWFGWG